jgi:hypothetical protein
VLNSKFPHQLHLDDIMRFSARLVTSVVPLALLVVLATSGAVLSDPAASGAPNPVASVVPSAVPSAAPSTSPSPAAVEPGQVSVYYSTNIGGEVDPCG